MESLKRSFEDGTILKVGDVIDEMEYNYLMDGSGIEGDEAEDGYFGFLKQTLVVRLLQIVCAPWISRVRAFSDCVKEIKPKQIVAADGSVSYKRPSLASLRKNTKRF